MGRGTEPYQYGRNGSVEVPVQKLRVTVPLGRDEDIDKAVLEVLRCWVLGQHVCVHCNQSHHRGPIGAAAIMRRVEGQAVAAFLRWLADVRPIWPGHVAQDRWVSQDRRDLELISAQRWAGGLSLMSETEWRTALVRISQEEH